MRTLFVLLMLCALPIQALQTSLEQNVKTSAAASDAWLQLVDAGEYGESWDAASNIFKLTVPKSDWIVMMDKMRKPLGKVSSRTVLDQRTAQDPKGLPQGDYMVMFYNTSFSNKPSAYELVTLRLEDGAWKVLTYQVK